MSIKIYCDKANEYRKHNYTDVTKSFEEVFSSVEKTSMDIISDIKVGIDKTDGEYVVIPDRKEAIKYSIVNAKEGDIVLLLGKGHETYQEINGVKNHFDEREIIEDILKEIGWK